MTDTDRVDALARLRENPVATIPPLDLVPLLGLSKNTIYDAISRGDIPSIRVGRRILIPVPRLLAMIDGEG